jgi:hypothetical protein
MGQNVSMKHRQECFAGRTLVLGFLALLIFSGACQMHESLGKEDQVVRRVGEQIDRFRRGEEFRGGAEAFMVDGQPDPKVLRVLQDALSTEHEPVREQVAKLLVAIGRQSDPLYRSGGRLVRNQQILRILVDRGIFGATPTRDDCLEVLHWSVPADLLREYSETLISNLRQWPDNTILLVVAKAKPPSARAVVAELMRSPRWAENENVRIAKAALGDQSAEKSFVGPFLATQDPKKKQELAKQLGFIGTKSALEILASQMRTNLILEVPMVYRRSVRLDVMAALSYNFPDRTFLYDNAVVDDSGYARVEQFCEETFGTKWQSPRPPFLTIQGFPSELLP